MSKTVNAIEAMEERNYNTVRELFRIVIDNSNKIEFLKIVALTVSNKECRDDNKISDEMAISIFRETRDQLELLGEDVGNIVDGFDLI